VQLKPLSGVATMDKNNRKTKRALLIITIQKKQAKTGIQSQNN
jgi:hypothetical protein